MPIKGLHLPLCSRFSFLSYLIRLVYNIAASSHAYNNKPNQISLLQNQSDGAQRARENLLEILIVPGSIIVQVELFRRT